MGPEIVWKALRSRINRKKWGRLSMLCVGARKPFDQMGAPVIEADPSQLIYPRQKGPFIWLLPAPTRAPRGALLPGFQSGWAIQTAAQLIQRGQAKALITGPISKERLQKGGFPYVGHTDFLADLCGIKEDFTMMLANEKLRVSLVTTHLALADVPKALNRHKIRRAVLQTASHLRDWWGISRPRIGVAALNPHAGEGGILGSEERTLITPVLRELRRSARGHYQIEGPLPADTLFAGHLSTPRSERFDAVVCMYHDQGLIPVKLLDFPRTVNVTLGLPLIRTSVDHGTAFDIAGKGMADPSSLESAIALAIQIVQTRDKKGLS